MKKLLVPTDFSTCALDAYKVACDIARVQGGEIVLIHVNNYLGPGLAEPTSISMQMVAEAVDRLHEELDKWKQMEVAEGLNVTTDLLEGSPVWRIHEQDKFKDADLIVMGTTGAGNSWLVGGSNAQKVVQLSDIPVLSLHRYFDINAVNEVVFASNFYTEAKYGIEKIKKLQELFGWKVHLVKVITPANFETSAYTQKLFNDFIRDNDVQNYETHTYNAQSLEEGVLEFAYGIGAGLITMETHGRSGFAHLFLRSKAEAITDRSEIPVLTARIVEPEVDHGVIFPELKHEHINE